MDNALANFIGSIGAMAEMSAVFRDQLMKNGFDREEAMYLTGILISSITQSAGGSK